MFLNYLITAWRNLLKNKLFSAINILGLGIGLSAFILIFLYVQNELFYDNFIPEAESIYRVEGAMVFPGRPPMESVAVMSPTKETFLSDFSSEVLAGTRIFRNQENVVQDDVAFGETINYVDPNFFEFFDLDFDLGDEQGALKDLSSIAISSFHATKFFGQEDPIGQSITLENGRVYNVTAVFSDLPQNSHFDLDLIARFDTSLFPSMMPFIDNWYGWGFYTYLKLASPEAAEIIEKDFEAFVDKNVAVQYGGYEDARTSDIIKFNLTQLNDIHLYSSSAGAMTPRGSPITVYIFVSVAFLIIFIANINYINLSTARSSFRAREISLRKVVGARKKQLVIQFLGESILTTGLAMILALGLVELLLPSFSTLMNVPLDLDLTGNGILVVVLFGAFLFVGILGGLYPAFSLTRFLPAKILNANQSSSGGGNWIRQTLVVVQFSISIVLIVSSLIVYGQLYFAMNLDLGFEKENVVVLNNVLSGQDDAAKKTFQDEVGRIPSVAGVSSINSSPFEGGGFHVVTQPPLGGDTIIVNGYAITDSFIPSLDIPVLFGRNLSEDFAGDIMVSVNNRDENTPSEFSVLANQSLLSLYGLPTGPDSLGTTFKNGTGDTTYKIVGVIPDLYYETVREKVFPSFYFYNPSSLSDVLVRFRGSDFLTISGQIQAIADQMMPGTDIRATLLEDTLAQVYDPDQKRGQMFIIFAILAIVIASLGLFSLASLVVAQKTKEVGIRKVLGASVRSIINLFVWQFLKPVLVANLIAWPIAWYFMNDWLAGFAYRIDLSLIYFAGAGLLAVGIAVFTVGGRAYRAARANPIKALRYE